MNAVSQGGVLPPANTQGRFITLMVQDGTAAAAQVRAAVAGFDALTRRIAEADPAAALVSVVAFGSACWDRLFEGPRPAELGVFPVIDTQGRHAPSTRGDILLHLRGERRDLLFELGRQMLLALGDAVSVVEDVSTFRYLDARDLTGFVDGTENPEGEERAEVALVDDDPAFAGGSYIHMQRYVHDLASWEQLPVAEQENVIGRTKADDVEMKPPQRLPTAHISRADLKVDGEKMEILRHSMPYGDADEAGLVFIAYGKSPRRFESILHHMLEADGEGHFDHLMLYTRAVTGVAFFAPSLDFLRETG